MISFLPMVAKVETCVGVGNSEELVRNGGEQVGTFVGKDHGAAGAKTHNTGCLFKQSHNLIDLLGL